MPRLFLVEIGSEELPYRSLHSLAYSFFARIKSHADALSWAYDRPEWFYTPRRLAVRMRFTNEIAADSTTMRKFFPQGFGKNPKSDADAPCSSAAASAELPQTPDGWIRSVLACVVEDAIRSVFCSKKNARDRLHHLTRYIRNVTVLLDDQVIPGKILGIRVDRTVLGHRFMGKQKILLDHAEDYVSRLSRAGKVMVDPGVRAKIVTRRIEALSRKIKGTIRLTDSGLRTVVSTTEWPVVRCGTFPEKFLRIPQAVLAHIISDEQKSFVVQKDGALLPCFVFVSNIETKHSDDIVFGNTTALCSRLSDADFFLSRDKAHRLEERFSRLKNVVFHEKLGSVMQHTERIVELSRWIAESIHADAEHTRRAAFLSKCGSVTEMASAFPSQTGCIGMHYALLDHEPSVVALAQKEQYFPRFSADALPSTKVSCALSLANKMDFLSGLCSVVSVPRTNDPFALRRTALGIIRILIGKRLRVDIQSLIEKSVSLYSEFPQTTGLVEKIKRFIWIRLLHFYKHRGYRVRLVQSVLSTPSSVLEDVDGKVKAMDDVFSSKESMVLTRTYKRVSRILALNSRDVSVPCSIKDLRLQERCDIRLADHLIVAERTICVLLRAKSYKEALIRLLHSCGIVDSFFRKTLVLARDETTRRNRLILLDKFRGLLSKIADFSVLVAQ